MVNENIPIEKKYQKKTQLEHILLRPDTYVGSVEKEERDMSLYDDETKQMKKTCVTYVPALYKIFDEILVNAIDHHVRDPSMNQIRVEILNSKQSVRVWNNGEGIPVAVHPEYGLYVPELVFGHLLTSSNYDDNEKKVTGGRNGYGAKLTNVFSTVFTIETFDAKRGLLYEQKFTDNMTQIHPPRIRKKQGKNGWTCVTFTPDFPRFGVKDLDDDTILVFRQRVYDTSGVLPKSCKVYWNGDQIPIRSFSEYVSMYMDKENSFVMEQPHPRWSIAVGLNDTQQFEQVSFVNGIRTSRGGTHVQYVTEKIVSHTIKALTKKLKTTIRPSHIKPHLQVFIHCQIENPSFDSQTKETLTTRAPSFGSSFEFSDSFFKKLFSIGIVDRVTEWFSSKSKQDLKKTDGVKRTRLIGISKLDDANWAGTKRSGECMLLLTEGLSAKALAVAGLSVVGRDKFGIYPLRGKLLNVRDASTTQITNNAEISDLKQILGLKHGTKYTDTSSLRYGSVVIMTDQDHDGSHIKGLVMNFLHVHFPSLLQLPGFLKEFITPIIRVKKGNVVRSFYTIPEYKQWAQTVTLGQWNIKYYKGLGTSTSAEAREYFSDLQHHLKPFVWDSDTIHDRISLAFSKHRADDRKKWIAKHTNETYLDHSSETISYGDFLDRELVAFSVADLRRSIPSVCDGMKPGQRKVLYACFLRNLKEDIKVAQLAGYVSEKTAYHHGEASLHGTIIGMAQRFIGSNNMNLLVPSGQFGSRAHGGADAASPRYIFTRLEKWTRLLFPADDDACLVSLEDDGQTVEPEHYVPIVPMVLVNGAEGIGTGWRTFIPNHNILDIIENIKRRLNKKSLTPMHPFYEGFQGKLEQRSDTQYVSSGIIRKTGDTTVEISELPFRAWTQTYKEWLETCIRPETGQPRIEDYKEYHTEERVRFVVRMNKDQMSKALTQGLPSYFRLESTISLTQLVLFDSTGMIKRYRSTSEIFEEWFQVRYALYQKRRLLLIQKWEEKQSILESKVKFIQWVLDGTISLQTSNKVEIDKWLFARSIPQRQGTYDYLWSMPMVGLTLEKVSDLKGQIKNARNVLRDLYDTTVETMWRHDIEALESSL